jgi:hypothetical protein
MVEMNNKNPIPRRDKVRKKYYSSNEYRLEIEDELIDIYLPINNIDPFKNKGYQEPNKKDNHLHS